MAIISFTNYKHGQTKAGMGAVMRYTMQEKKTLWDERRLVTGVNCRPETVYADFLTTKNLWHKTDGVQFYHMVQSFPKGAEVDPVTAHAAALELAKWYAGHEVLVCTHTDREHIHSHMIINSTSLESGCKLHIAKEELESLRQRNDEVCLQFGLPVFQPRPPKKTRTPTIRDVHLAQKQQSKKLELMRVICDCMRHAADREQFIALMESEGYKVRWETSRQNITYTAPSGWQCRDRKLFGDKFLKENMEYEFKLRADALRRGTDKDEHAQARHFTAAAGAAADANGAGDADLREPDGAQLESTSGAGAASVPAGEAAGRAPARSADEAGHRTLSANAGKFDAGASGRFGENEREVCKSGWEPEREIFLHGGQAHEQSAGGYAQDTLGYERNVSPTVRPAGGDHGRLLDLADNALRLAHDLGKMSGGEDENEYRARIEAQNFGAVAGLVIGTGLALYEKARQDAPAEPELDEQRWEQTM